MSVAAGRRDPLLLSLFGLALMLAALLVLVPHVTGYFFLFDDFAVVATVAKRHVHDLFSASAGGGFYRPVALTLVRLESALFGWSLPGGYAAVSALVHVANASMVAILLGRMGERLEAALFGGTVALLSPWAGEAFFWFSAQFDLLAVSFALAALLLAFRGAEVAEAGRWRWLYLLAVFALALASCLSKEMTVTLPLVHVLCVLWKRGDRGTLRAAIPFSAAMAAAAATTLLLRSGVGETLGGGYGSLPELLTRGALASNAWSYLRAAVVVPGGTDLLHAVPFAAAMASLLSASLLRSPRKALLGAAGFLVTLVPVLWSALERGSTAGGRYLYFPGLWVAFLAAAGLSGLLPPSGTRRGSPLAAVLVGLVLAFSLTSLLFQRRLWHEAAGLSRAAVRQVGMYRGKGDLLFVQNLPYSLAGGPQVLKSYAFRLYFGAERPKVRARAVILERRGDGFAVTGSFPDPFSEYSPPPGGGAETELTLDLSGR